MRSIIISGLTITLMFLVFAPAFADATVIKYDPAAVLLELDTNLEMVMDFENDRVEIEEPILDKLNSNNNWSPFNLKPADWSKENSTLQKTVVFFILMDWLQTRYISKNPDRYEEANPILGPNPSLEEVDRYFAVCLIGNTLIAYLLPQKLRIRWQVISLRMQLETVNHNYNMGIKFSL